MRPERRYFMYAPPPRHATCDRLAFDLRGTIIFVDSFNVSTRPR